MDMDAPVGEMCSTCFFKEQTTLQFKLVFIFFLKPVKSYLAI